MWYALNDSSRREVKFSNIQKQQAYLLVYLPKQPQVVAALARAAPFVPRAPKAPSAAAAPPPAPMSLVAVYPYDQAAQQRREAEAAAGECASDPEAVMVVEDEHPASMGGSPAPAPSAPQAAAKPRRPRHYAPTWPRRATITEGNLGGLFLPNTSMVMWWISG